MANSIYVSKVSYEYISNCLDKLICPTALASKRIIIKPNVRSCHKPEKAKTTNPETLDHVLRYLKFTYPNEVIVADSSIIGVDTKEAARISGIGSVCKKNGVPFCDVRDFGFRRVEIPIPPYYVEISELFFEQDFIINMPKLKSTYGFPLSLSAKNLKGIISDQSKLDFHTYGVQERVALLNSLIRCDLSIVDGLYSLSLDTVVKTNLVFISNNSLAIDYAIAQGLGYSENDMRYLKEAPKEFEFVYSDEEVKREFESLSLKSITPERIKENFGVSIIGTPCSACAGCIYKAISKRTKKSKIRIIAGCGHHVEENDCLYVGNCAVRELSPGMSNIVVGCPPQISEIIQMLDAEGDFD